MLEIFLCLGVIFAFLIYGKIAVDVLARGQGKVSVEGISFADILIGSMLVGLIGYASFTLFHAEAPKEPPKLSWEGAISASIVFGSIVLAIIVSLATRGVNFARMSNLMGVSVRRAFVSALFLAVFAFPLIYVVYAFSAQHTGKEEQAIIQALRNTPEWSVRSSLFFSAILVAPLYEEIVFRGYLYPLFKRYCGISFSILMTSVLFALVHGHAPSLAPLFVLAVCFTLAYEISGSLLVPLLMHSLFNGSQLAIFLANLTEPT